ncbi:MAG TPA: SDR family NAD(P)-dependent oxidoreductase, partial [Luteitalea sp.]|nr:SDR family NAD(P)-dependent oxidoreductase [Luteitalea sp.]
MSFESLALTSHVALVTGGSRGIGRAIVETLARRGAAVAFSFKEREAPARALVDRLTAEGCRVWTGQCDVADEAQVQALVAEATTALGAPDILVNNAGVTRDGYLMMMDREKWDAVVRPNLDGAFFCTRAVVRGMLLRRWGRVVSLTSPSAVAGLPGQANYA